MRRKVPTKGTIKIGKRKRGVIWLSRPSTLSVIFSMLSTVLIVTALMAAGIPVIWMGWYRLKPETSQQLAMILQKPVTSFSNLLEKEVVDQPEVIIYQPPWDTTLSQENMIKIEKIGVETAIVEEPTERYEEAFRQGVWRVPEFGDAYNRDRPMILAAHRFGYLAWTNSYRRKNSFYNLPKLEQGDEVEIIWGQRRYLYRIYAGEESKEITDYTADLILYTCKFLESEDRIFRYARLVEKGFLRVDL
jgi:sortase (surface protein transpeptidase)